VHSITAVADVRSTPYSRRHPHFSKEPLSKALANSNISYVSLGKELGTKNPVPECIVDGLARFHLIASRPEFSSGLKRITRGMENFVIALMCAEEDPLSCHRTLLICRHLRQRINTIHHIRGDGEIESNELFEQRLIEKTGSNKHDLFETDTNIINNAYQSLGERISFRP
jgi:uncharacterized protein (DUF488 family)